MMMGIKCQGPDSNTSMMKDVHSLACPNRGKVVDLLQMLEDPGKYLLLDGRVDLCRKENPLLKDP